MIHCHEQVYVCDFIFTVIQCKQPDTILKGSLTFKNTLYGSSVLYSCNTGYVLSGGNALRFCTLDGTWNGTSPKCQGKTRHV